jgi:hypothetical protein
MKLDRELRLSEAEAQATSLVRAVEATDRAGLLIPHAERRRATAAARAAAADPEAVETWIGRRALALTGALEERLRALPAIRRSTRLGKGLAPLSILSLAAGVATNALGPSRQIQVLAVPLLGLILWNLAVLASRFVRRWLLRRVLGPASSTAVTWLAGLVERLVRRGVVRGTPAEEPRGEQPPRQESERDLARRALTGFVDDWFPAVQPLALSRVRRFFHASALVVVAGAVAGMYFRGLVWEYRVSWQSTFQSDEAAEWVLTRALSPAGAVLGIEVPPQPLDDIRGPENSGPAAPWIHLWAVTAAIFVGVPRTLLLAVESRRCARLARRLPLRVPETYLRRLLAAADGSVRRISVLPYSHRPGVRQLAALKGLILDLFGSRSDVGLQATLDYGAAAAPPADAAAGRIVLFSLAQTPEIEVHGELLGELRDHLEDGGALLAVVDGSVYRQRLGGSGPDGGRQRLEERRRGWDRVIEEAGLQAVHLDLEQPLTDDDLRRMVAAAWPPGILEGPT